MRDNPDLLTGRWRRFSGKRQNRLQKRRNKILLAAGIMAVLGIAGWQLGDYLKCETCALAKKYRAKGLKRADVRFIEINHDSDLESLHCFQQLDSLRLKALTVSDLNQLGNLKELNNLSIASCGNLRMYPSLKTCRSLPA